MKGGKILMVGLLSLSFLWTPLVVNKAEAAGWYICFVNSISEDAGMKTIKLTNADGSTSPIVPGTSFYLNDGTASGNNAMFSAALTAMASGMKVSVYINSTTIPYNPNDTITALGLETQ